MHMCMYVLCFGRLIILYVWTAVLPAVVSVLAAVCFILIYLLTAVLSSIFDIDQYIFYIDRSTFFMFHITVCIDLTAILPTVFAVLAGVFAVCFIFVYRLTAILFLRILYIERSILCIAMVAKGCQGVASLAKGPCR